MFKLCVAIAIIGCLATLIEGQNIYRQQRLPFYQQQQYNQLRGVYYPQNQYQQYQQAARFPSYYGQQQRLGFYNPNVYNRNNFLNNYYNRQNLAFVPQRALSNEHLARTTLNYNNARPDGSYEYAYETENGIRGQERNVPKVQRITGELSGNAAGSYGYTSPEGLKVAVDYQADEDGFRPVLSYGGNGAGQFVNSPNPSSTVINRSA